MMLKIGDRVKKTGPSSEGNIGRYGTIVGFGKTEISKSNICYWISWDYNSPKTKNLYHENFVEKIDNQQFDTD